MTGLLVMVAVNIVFWCGVGIVASRTREEST